MPIDPNAIVNSPVGTLLLSLMIIGAFVTGTIVSGKSFDRLYAALERLTTALETRNQIDQAAMNKHGTP